MSILALDFATKTGWAHSSGKSGVWDFSIKPDESNGFRLVRFRRQLEDTTKELGVKVIVFEAVSVARGKNRSVNSFKLQSKMQGVLETFCHDYAIEHCAFNLKEIKAHAVRGNAKKEEVLAAAKKKWPKTKFEDDNQADARWLLDLYETRYGSTGLLRS